MFDRAEIHRTANGPRLLVVSGGKQGVGATTLAVNLAATLAADALRVVLVDADFSRPGIAAQCGVSDAIGIGDVLAGRRSVHEAIQRGPAGLQVVAGLRPGQPRGNLPERISNRVLRQFRSLAPHADWVVIDCGHESHHLVAEFWSAAEQVLLVTSPDAVAVMDTYSLVKHVLSRQPLARELSLIVNQARDEASAADVHRRVDQSCRRFLGVSLDYSAALPLDVATRDAAQGSMPLALRLPESPLACAIEGYAARVIVPRDRSQRERIAA
jgi:flagellar biosynthesis protein FlhG